MDRTTVTAYSPGRRPGYSRALTWFHCGLLLIAFATINAHTTAVVHGQAGNVAKRAEAFRVPGGAVRVDGRLDEALWATAVPITDFIQREPDEGALPTDRVEVRFVYDDSALYVGARMLSSGPVQAPLGRRDNDEQVEYLQIELDTYRDRRTAYMFGVTAAGAARTSIGDQVSDVRVTPRTTWGVARIIQEIGDQGSTVGAHLTAMHRGMSSDDPLAALLSRNAITFGADTRLRFNNGGYEAQFNVGLTHIDGEETAIAGFQRRNSHLLQRIDQPTIRFDPTRRSMDGAQIRGSLNKIAGRHWLWRASLMIESPEFEPSDFGRLNFAGDVDAHYRLTYRETVPGRVFRAYSFAGQISSYNYFDRDLGIRYNLTGDSSFTFLNFWRTNFDVTRYFRGQDAQLTRGGPVMGVPLGWNANWSLRGRASSETHWSVLTGYQSNELGDYTWRFRGGVSIRPSPSLQLSVEPDYRNERGTRGTFSGPINRQYLTTLPGGATRSIRAALHLWPTRQHTTLDAAPGQLHVQAGHDARRLC